MDIEDIKEFSNKKDNWYHIKFPDGTSLDELVGFERILNNSGIKGEFLMTTGDINIEDITKYRKE